MWWLLHALALARPTVEEAELHRLDEEMDKLASRNNWSGVERSYLSLVTLAEGKGLALTHEQHVLGAAAAQSRGDVQERWRRLNAAQVVRRDLDTQGEIAMIEATHGQVSLDVGRSVHEVPILEVLDPPGPAEQHTIDAVRVLILDRRHFEGLLPLGRYRLGALTFEIDGGPAQSHTVTAATSPPPTPPGHVLISASAPTVDRDSFDTKMAAVIPLLEAIEGVTAIGVLSPAPEVTHLDFDGGQLNALGATPTDLARSVQDGLGLPQGSVVARPTSLVLRQEVDPIIITSLHVAIPGGSIGLLAITSMRRGPDGFSLPPGVDLAVTPEADRERVKAEAASVLGTALPEWFAVN